MNFENNPRVQQISNSTSVDILVIIGILMTLIKMWKDCGFSDKAIQRRLRRPSLIWKASLRNKVKEAVPEDKVDQVYEAFLEHGKEIQLDEINVFLAS